MRITTAPQSAQQDLEQRRRRYIVSMTLRTLCFVGAILVGPGWVRWVLVVGALVLPYIAVVLANNASPRVEGTDLRPAGGQHKELGR